MKTKTKRVKPGCQQEPCSESLGWDATEKIYGGIWEMTTPSGRVFRMDLHATHGLGFQAMRRIHIEFTNDHKAAWEIARKCVFRKVDSLHGRPQNVRPLAPADNQTPTHDGQS